MQYRSFDLIVNRYRYRYLKEIFKRKVRGEGIDQRGQRRVLPLRPCIQPAHLALG